MTAAAAILRELASVSTSLSDETRLRRDTKMSRRVRLDHVSAAVQDALRLGAIGFDAVKHLVLCRLTVRGVNRVVPLLSPRAAKGT